MTSAGAVCAAVLAMWSAGVVTAQESASPGARPEASATPGAPCVAPGPPPVARIISVEPVSPLKREYYVRVAIAHANVAAALQARQGRTLVDAFPLAKTERRERNEAVMISLLRLKPGDRYSVDMVGWEYPAADFSCWKYLRVPLGTVTPP